MFEPKDFFNEPMATSGKINDLARVVGRGIGYLTIFTILIFTATHGVSVSLRYAPGGLGRVAAVVGIVSNELILFSMMLRYHNGDVVGVRQKLVALLTMGVGLVIIGLGTLLDSWVNAKETLTDWMQIYLTYILPISPLIMATLSHIVDELSPGQLDRHAAIEANQEIVSLESKAHIATLKAEIETKKAILNASLNARMLAAKTVSHAFQSQTTQEAIKKAALSSLPALLQSIGVDYTPSPSLPEPVIVQQQPEPELEPENEIEPEPSFGTGFVGSANGNGHKNFTQRPIGRT